jgi:hypothetical protein
MAIKALQVQTVIGSVSSRKDKSLRLSVTTPELSTTERAKFMDMQGVLCETLFQPADVPFAEIDKVETDMDQKSPSQRLRNVLYILFKQNPEGHDLFPAYYNHKMEGILEHLKGKIDES